MDITLVQLRMLREFDRCGTIVAAADRLGYTPSAISQQLSGMERAVGFPVLEKAGRNVFLTEVGKTLVAHAGIILDQVERARVDVENLRCGVIGTLKVGMTTSVSSLMLAPIIERLGQKYPHLSIRTLDTSFSVSQDLVRSGDLDVCFTADV